MKNLNYIHVYNRSNLFHLFSAAYFIPKCDFEATLSGSRHFLATLIQTHFAAISFFSFFKRISGRVYWKPSFPFSRFVGGSESIRLTFAVGVGSKQATVRIYHCLSEFLKTHRNLKRIFRGYSALSLLDLSLSQWSSTQPMVRNDVKEFQLP